MAEAECEIKMKHIGQTSAQTDWASVWSDEDFSRWDYLSHIIFNEIRSISGGFASKSIIEVGSGTGRISARMSADGAWVTLMDMDPRIVSRSKTNFYGERGAFIAGALPDIPIKPMQFDIVWNAGVLEHFSEEGILRVLSDMARICKSDGLVITLNPFKGSVLHTAGVKFMSKRSLYPFIDEYPIKTLKDMGGRLDLRLVKQEYSVGFFLLIVGMFKRLSLIPRFKALSRAIFWALSDATRLIDASFLGPALRVLDKIFSKVFGGYLLVSVFSPYKKLENVE